MKKLYRFGLSLFLPGLLLLPASADIWIPEEKGQLGGDTLLLLAGGVLLLAIGALAVILLIVKRNKERKK